MPMYIYAYIYMYIYIYVYIYIYIVLPDIYILYLAHPGESIYTYIVWLCSQTG